MNKSYKWLLLITCICSIIQLHAQTEPFRFAWLSDIHIVRGSTHIGDLEKSVADINSMQDIRFTIITGDISDFGYVEDLKIAKTILDKLQKPYYIVPGNHDTKWSESGATVFQSIFGHRNIAFNYGNIEFVGFQTGPILRRGDGYITPPDLDWLSQQLAMAKAKERIIIPYTHYPLTRSMSNWYKLTDLFRKYDVPMVLVGHGHRNQKMNFEDIPGVMTRTNPAGKGRGGDRPVGYTLASVTADSIYFRERNPDINTSTLWHRLPLKPISYSPRTDISPDLSVNKNYPGVQAVWKINLHGGISSSAAYADGKIIAGDREGTVHCLALKDGKQKWRFKANGGIFSTPAVKDNKVVFGSTDSNIYCLNTGNGKLLWKFKADKWVLGSPVIEDNTVYIGASDGKFRALSLSSGKLLWQHEGINGWIETKPVIYQGKIFFGAWDNYFYGLDKRSGKLVWKWIRSQKEAYPSAFYAPAACWPVAAHGSVFIAGPDMVLTALNAQSGDTLWRTGSPKLNEAIGISGDGSKIFAKCTFDSTLIAYSATASQPEVLWKTTDHYGFDDNQSAILEKDGTVFYTFRNGLSIAVDASNGKILWKYKLGDVMLNAATPVSNKEVILTDVDGNIALVAGK